MSNQDSVSRRNFMGSAALASAAVSFPNILTAKSKGKEVIRFALIGCGGRGKGAAAQVMNSPHKTECVALADAFMDTAKGAQNYLKHVGHEDKLKVTDDTIFAGLDAYKKVMEMDNVDLVLLTTSPGFRPLHFEHAINKGKHVFMEKPVATDPVGVRKVLEVARKAREKKLNVVVGLQRHYQQKYLDLYQKVQDGKIGKIVGGQVYWNSRGVWVREREPGQSEMEYQMRNWYYFNWLCGDHILEQHIHNIDVANWFIGGYPSQAQGMGGRQVRNGKDHGEIFDHHFVEFTYDSGAVISSQCRHQPGCMRKVDETFQGTQGSVNTGQGKLTDLEGNEMFKYKAGLKTKSSGPSKSKADPFSEPNPYQVEHDQLFASIRNGGLIADAENGAKSTLTAIMGRMATYSGKVITWDQAMNSNFQIMPESVDWNSNPPTMPDSNGMYPIPTPGITEF